MAIKIILSSLMIIVLCLGINTPAGSQSLKTVKFMTPTLGVTVLPYVVATRLGFYRQEGLRVEIIRATLSPSLQALLSGSADYVKHGSAIGAILGGLPLKGLAVDTDRSLQYIIAKPEISSLKDLVGRTIAIDDVAGAVNWVVSETLLKNRVPIDKINLRRIGGPELRFQALITGLVDAASLSFVLAGRAKEKDFRSLVYTGEFATDIQLLVATSIEKMQKSPDEVYKFMKATLKARKFQFENPDEAYKFYLELEGINDEKFGRDAWEDRRRSSSKEARIGLLSEETMIESIMAWKGQMKLAGRPLKVEGRPEDVYDFGFARRALEEIRMEGWDARKYHYIAKQ